MTVFAGYARYYDLLYREKDYRSETAFVESLIRTHVPSAQRLLELGCGTGAHAVQLATRGFTVHGIDASTTMLERARARVSSLTGAANELLSFEAGDIRTCQVDGTFDAAISLFHVISYQRTNEDLRAALGNARRHLRASGVLIFDCWYGPAVLTDRPTVRVRRLEDDQVEVLRVAEPTMCPNENVVEVNYEIIVTDKTSGSTERLREQHPMRYFFQPEIDMVARECGFVLETACEFGTGRVLGFDTWSACYVLRARD